MKNWKVESAVGQTLAITYLGNALGATNLQNHKKINFFMYMGDIKIFAKNKK